MPILDGGGKGVPTLDEEGGTYLGWGRGYLPWMGKGVPTLDRLCRGRYASCGFPQEEFRVNLFYVNKLSLVVQVNNLPKMGKWLLCLKCALKLKAKINYFEKLKEIEYFFIKLGKPGVFRCSGKVA